MEDGEIVSSDEEITPQPITTKKVTKKTHNSNLNNVINNKDKRGAENKENRSDKKKKGSSDESI